MIHAALLSSKQSCKAAPTAIKLMTAASALLEQLQLAGVSCQESSDQLEQVCQDSSAAAAIDWLAQHGRGPNLSTNEASLMQCLKANDGQQPLVPKAHSSAQITDLISAVQREHESYNLLEACPTEAELQQRIAHYESTLLQLQCRLKSLQSLGSAFSKQSAVQKQGAADYHSTRTAVRLDKTAKRLNDQQSACNALLQELQQAAAQMKTKYEQQAAEWLLNLADVQSLHHQDALLQTALERLYKKQFEDADAASSHHQDVTKDWSHDHGPTHPDSMYNVLKGPDQQAYDENVQELNRLRWIHETSQMQHITTLAWQAKQEAMLQSVKLSQDRAAALQEPALMQAELTRLQAELTKLTTHKQQLLDQLPGLCKQVAAQQDTAVLQQDYNAKLLRQNYYISKKQAFAELLLQQHARHEVLNLAREEEAKQLQATRQELHLLHELLSDVRTASQQRMSHYAHKQLQPITQAQLVVHDNDSFLQTLERLLPDIEQDTASADGSNQNRLYVTLEQLGQKLSALSQWDLKLEVQQQSERMQAGAAASMQATFGQLHPLVFASKETADAQLTTPEVEEAMQLAQNASFDLTAEVNRIALQQQTYQNILHQQHKQLGAERAVFSMFHNQPEHLGLLAL